MREKKIRELVKIVEQSNIDELEIKHWLGQTIKIKKYGSRQFNALATEKEEMILSQQTPPTSTSSVHRTAKEEPIKSSTENTENLVEIKAPMVGTFYRAPSPDSEPYTKEGDVIAPGQVLCIIEAMKLMNEIESEMSGRIKKILVENAQPVEYDQPLFLVEKQ